MLAQGAKIDDVAQACGVSPNTVRNWQSQAKGEILAIADAKVEGLKEGAAEARARCSALAPSMVAVLERLANASLEPSEAPGAAVNARAAMALLDRGGVPVLTKLEHSGEAVTEATIARLKAALEAARKP